MSYNIRYCCITHRGKRRSNNEDNFMCDGRFSRPDNVEPLRFNGVLSSKNNPLCAVFDGMGGEECGEIASYIAAQIAAKYSFENPVDGLKGFCFDANSQICKYMTENGISSMGTTAAMLLFNPKSIYLCNVGDSRVYRLYKNELQQISKDHVISVPGKSKPYLSQNLGIPETEIILEPYLAAGNSYAGDIYLICSDGVTDMISNSDIKRIIKDNDLDSAADLLLNTALENGGKDNITLILCKIEG